MKLTPFERVAKNNNDFPNLSVLDFRLAADCIAAIRDLGDPTKRFWIPPNNQITRLAARIEEQSV